MQPNSLKISFTVAEAMAATGLGKTTLYEEIGNGRLRAKKRGATTLIRGEDLRHYIDSLPDFPANGENKK